MTKLTIAILALKSEYFEESLVSVLKQTCKDFKLYILDNSQNENIYKIAERYKTNKCFEYIKNETNVGQAQNYVNAINLCDTEYLWVFHDDDIAKQTLAEKEVKFLDEHKDVAVVSCNYDVINEYGVIVDKTDIYRGYSGIANKNEFTVFDIDELVRIRHKGLYLPTPAKIFRTEVLKKLDYSIYLRNGIASDAVMEFMANEHGKAALLEERLLKYRIHKGQESKNKYKMDQDYIRDCIPIIKKKLPEKEVADIENVSKFNLLTYEIGKRFCDYSRGQATDYVPEQAAIMGIKNSLPENAKDGPLLYFGKKTLILKNRFPPGHMQDYMIWGAGSSGMITLEVLKQIIPSMNCSGFIDKFRRGTFCGLPIYNLNDFIFDKKYYIMVCTMPGAVEAYETLIHKSYKEFDDFYYGYGFDF